MIALALGGMITYGPPGGPPTEFEAGLVVVIGRSIVERVQGNRGHGTAFCTLHAEYHPRCKGQNSAFVWRRPVAAVWQRAARMKATQVNAFEWVSLAADNTRTQGLTRSELQGDRARTLAGTKSALCMFVRSQDVPKRSSGSAGTVESAVISATLGRVGCEKSAHSNRLVLLFCDTVASRNISKSVTFQSQCKAMSANEPIWRSTTQAAHLALYAGAPWPHTAPAFVADSLLVSFPPSSVLGSVA